MNTPSGGKKAADTNLLRDPDFYKKIGKLGGQKSRGGGFASDLKGNDGLTGRERAPLAGKRGGSVSRRGRL